MADLNSNKTTTKHHAQKIDLDNTIENAINNIFLNNIAPNQDSLLRKLKQQIQIAYHKSIEILGEYLGTANYQVADYKNKNVLIITHKKYKQIRLDPQIRIPYIKKSELHIREDFLEAKINLDIQFLPQEIIVYLVKDKDTNKYKYQSMKHFEEDFKNYVTSHVFYEKLKLSKHLQN